MKKPVGGWMIRPLFSLLLCASLIGSGSFAVRAVSPGELIINRLQITGGPGKTDHDFVELYNASADSVNLNGLRLVKRTRNGTSDTTIKSWTSPILILPGAVYLWANSADGFAASLNADAASTQTLSNDNGIALRQGPENTGEIIDAVAWGEAQNGLNESTPFPENPGPDEILQRTDHIDRDRNMHDFSILKPFIPPVCGNAVIEGEEACDDGNTLDYDGCSAACRLEAPPIVCGNGIIESGEQCDDHNSQDGDGCSASCQTEITTPAAPDKRVYINEFIVDPVSGGQEWIELYSPSDVAFDISGWTLEEGSGTKTAISGNDFIGGDNHYFAIQKSLGTLNNSGDIIILRDSTGTIIHEVTYGDWDDGDISDNAPAASDPYSIARLPGATENGSDRDNYGPTSMLTMWAVNIIVAPPSAEPEAAVDEPIVTTPKYDYAKTITISEIFPDPVGIDETVRQNEFIELYNNGAAAVNLAGWRLQIGDAQYLYAFPASTFIPSQQYITVSASGNFQLANDGATVKLFQPLRTAAYQSVSYKQGQEGQSWALQQEAEAASRSWKWTFLPTPGQTNIFASPPVASFSVTGKPAVDTVIQFDASDSDDGATASRYLWNFGDGESSELVSPQHAFKQAGSYTAVLSVTNLYGASTISHKITIAGNERAEEREKAPTMVTAALAEKNHEEAIKAPSPFTLRFNEIMPNPEGSDQGQEWVEVINAGQAPIALDGWTVANKGKPGQAITSGIQLEPGELFVFSPELLPPNLGNTRDSLSLRDPEGKIADTLSYQKAPSGESYMLSNGTWHWTSQPTPGEANILAAKKAETAKTKKAAARQTLKGTVAALPGTFSSQYFYLQSDSPLLYQVYNSRKLFPELRLGQKIIVSGELSTTVQGPRLKTATAADVTVNGDGTAAELPLSSAAELKNPPHPRVARIEGEITSKKSPRLIVTDQSGDTEVYLAKGSGLSVSAFEIGDLVTVSGLTQPDGTSLRLMPRSSSDIIIRNAASGPETTVQSAALQQSFAGSARSGKKPLLTYIGLGALLALAAAGYGIWKSGILNKK